MREQSPVLARLRGAVALSVSLVLGASSLDAQEAEPPRTSVFNAEARPPYADYERSWFDVPTTYTEEHFDPIFLPFEYECRSGKPDVNQAFTFPHLLSLKFDHVPNNLTRAHPFFVYKRDEERVLELAENPTEDAIASFLDSWDCNYAFRGDLIQEGSQFGGALLVHGTSGKIIYDRQYEPRFGYFDLMGRMVRDWMAFEGLEVSEALGIELDRPMCVDVEAVRLLGTAALGEEMSEEVLSVYASVLEIAPEFAEVRYWLAGQRERVDGDAEKSRTAMAEALESHFVPFALVELDTPKSDDEDLKERALEWVEFARAMSPADARYAEIEIELRDDQRNLTLEELEPYVADCLASASYTYLHEELAFEFRCRHAFERSLPFAISGLRSHLDVSRAWLWAELAVGFTLLGEHRDAIECAQNGLPLADDDVTTATMEIALGRSLRERFRFLEARDAYLRAYAAAGNSDSLALAILASYEAGEPGLEERVDGEDLSESVWAPLLATRRFLSIGWVEQAQSALPPSAIGERQWPAGYADWTQMIDLRHEIEVLRGDVAYLADDREGLEEAAVHAWKLDPFSRRGRRLLTLAFTGSSKLPEPWLDAEQLLREGPAGLGSGDEAHFTRAREHLDQLRVELSGLDAAGQRALWQGLPPWEIEVLALDLARAGDLEAALELYLDYMQSAEELSDGLQNLTRIFVRRLLEWGDDDLRQRTLALLEERPSGPPWHISLQAQALYRDKEYERAIPLFEKVGRMNDEPLYFHHFYLGICYRKLGKLDQAVEELERYLSQHPEDTSAYLHLARAQAAADSHQGVHRAMRSFFEHGGLEGWDDEARDLLRNAAAALAEVELASGRKEAALEWLEPLDAAGAVDEDVEALRARCREGAARERQK